MTIYEFYAVMGGDPQEALGRMMGEEMLRRFIRKFVDDPSYPDLVQAMEAEDRASAFRAAHTIKGLCMNLGFEKLHQSSAALTEALRGEMRADAQKLMGDVVRDYALTVQAIAELN